MRRITESMAAFRANPAFAAGTLPDSERSDEIGIAQRELATLQQGPRDAPLQQTRLAALGTAVPKVNTALRHILATPRLNSTRLPQCHTTSSRERVGDEIETQWEASP